MKQANMPHRMQTKYKVVLKNLQKNLAYNKDADKTAYIKNQIKIVESRIVKVKT